MVNGCSMCLITKESTNHLMIHYSFATRVSEVLAQCWGCFGLCQELFQISAVEDKEQIDMLEKSCGIYLSFQGFGKFALRGKVECSTIKVLKWKNLCNLLSGLCLIGTALIRIFKEFLFMTLLSHGMIVHGDGLLGTFFYHE